MQKSTRVESIAPNLDDLLNDGRLERLFSKDGRHCALQLWVLQINSGQLIEHRIVYGRLLPYSHSNERWSASYDDNFYTFGQVQARIVLLNLYVKSIHCANLLRRLSAGQTVSTISEELGFGLPDQLKERFGAIALPAARNLIYRPVVYLLNRDAHDRHSPSSPHGAAGAFSASITQIDKGALFRLGEDYDVALTDFVVKNLNADTGLEFGGADTSRFGDLELLVFPTLDDFERPLLGVSWADAPHTLVARFNPMQVAHFNGFQFRMSIENGGQVAYSSIATALRNEDGEFECKFELSDQLRERTDSTELEIFGFPDNISGVSTLCCRWRLFYIREIRLQGHAVGHSASPVKFDWLENAARPTASARVKAALTVNRGNMGFTNHIGRREADPWVPVNRDLESLFKRLSPPKSEARFFLRWSQDDGEGRLQFVEWFRALLAKYKQHQVIIFDPYFGDVGLGLVLLCAESGADYIVFTSLPKPGREGRPMRRKSDKLPHERINNLLANCEHNGRLLKRIKLRIYGLKEGRLHDRYLLVVGPDGLPIAGFNLSNSIQKAAENYPLLVTPIPADILLKVEQYKSALVQEAETARSAGETENPSMRLLFDSTASSTEPRRYEPLRFLEKAQAGDVLSTWTGEPSLQGLSGDRLKEQMAALGLLNDDSLALHDTAGLSKCLHKQAGDFTDFAATWEVLGEVLAHSRDGDRRFSELASDGGFLKFLARFVEASFCRTHEETDRELAVVDGRLFQMPITALLHSSYRHEHLFHGTKYAALTWSESYAIKLLWWYASDTLLTIAEAQVARVSIEPLGADVMRLSLLSQIVSDISLSIQFDISDEQRDRLVRSDNGLLRWLGLNAIERQSERPEGLAPVLKLITAFSYPEQVQALGWMVFRAAKNEEKAAIYVGLVAALHDALPTAVPCDELRRLVDSMRGHMRQLAWAEPWLFKDVVFPLLQNGRANFDHACEIWMQELAGVLEPQFKDQPRLFDRAREGQTTNITAFVFANSSFERQQISLKSMQAILKRQQRIVQRPLASTSNWTQWDGALVVTMWILAFTRWAQYYLRQGGMSSCELDNLSREASELAMVRPIAEWRSKGTGEPGQLAAFLDQAEDLLASDDGPSA
ncbi:VPA1262 family protein [Paraburkholderia sediminicola]|uniref:VPA1262 family protein n=1 Tax=Paraburkholderia sediminicola TaxID=458836 RepID=UPI0038BADE42